MLFTILLAPINSTAFMKKTMVIFLCTCLSTVVSTALSNINTGTGYSIRAQNLISSFNDDTVKLLHFLFYDGLRQKWERISGWILKGNKNQGVSMRNLLLN